MDAINRADIGCLAAIMTDDHIFIDSDGSRLAGKEAVLDGWSSYFVLVRDYRLIVHETFCAGNTVMLAGDAAGVISGSAWIVPAAWRAVTQANKIAVWQVYVNPEPILAAMGDRKNA